MQIGKIYLNTNQKRTFDNIIDAYVDFDNKNIEFNPINHKKCIFKLFGYNYTGNNEYDGANLGSEIKQFTDVDIELYFNYSLINIINELNDSTDEIFSKYILKVYYQFEYENNIDNIELFTYELKVVDFKYSPKYNTQFALVESILLTDLDSFIIRYNDINGNDIMNDKDEYKYLPFTKEEFNSAFIKESVIPDDVFYMSIYKQHIIQNTSSIDIKLCTIDINHSKLTQDSIYNVGIIGNINANSSNIDDVNNTIENLSQLFTTNNCQFMCGTGNITTDLKYTTYNSIRSSIKSNININKFIPIGNYDNGLIWGNNTYKEIWNKHWAGTLLENEEIFRCPSDSSSFYFLKDVKIDNKITYKDCYIFLSVEFLDRVQYMKYGTHENHNSYQVWNYQAYNPQTIKWLYDVLEINKYHRIFLFTNLFFGQKAGNYNNSDNLYQMGTYDKGFISDYHSDILCGKQFRMLNEINNKYKNCIIFSGNSDYSFRWQTKDSNIIICNHDYPIDIQNNNYIRISNEPICSSGYTIHVPSLYSALPISTSKQSTTLSEAMIMKVYDKYVDIIGYQLRGVREETLVDLYSNNIYPYAHYRLNIQAK